MKKMFLLLGSMVNLSAMQSGFLDPQYPELISAPRIFAVNDQACQHNTNVHLDALVGYAQYLTPQDLRTTAYRRSTFLRCPLATAVEVATGNTLLHWIALIGGRSDTALYLITEANIDPTQANNNGLMPFQVAARAGHQELATILERETVALLGPPPALEDQAEELPDVPEHLKDAAYQFDIKLLCVGGCLATLCYYGWQWWHSENAKS